MGAFGTSNRDDRERRKNAVDFRREVRKGNSDNVERVHNRKWMILVIIIIAVLLVWSGVI